MSRVLFVGFVTLLQGCGLVAGLDEFGPRPDGGGTSTAGGAGSSGGAGSGGTGGEGATSSTTTGTGGAPCAVDVLITEVRTQGPSGGSDELVELYNPTNAQIDLASLRIVGKPLTSTSFNDKWSGAPTFLEPKQWIVIGGPGYSEGKLPDAFTLSQSFSNDQVIAVVRVEGANTTELDRVTLCCGEACKEFTDATLNPACDVSGGDVVLSLHREPACLDGELVPGAATPFQGAP